MLLLLSLCLGISVVLTQDIVGLSYNFHADFHENFNQDKCEVASEWDLVEYESLRVNQPLRNEIGARSSVNSCATSFPVIFVPNSVLEFVVYMNVVNKNSGLTIVVIDENDAQLFKYVFNGNNENFVAGWSRITLPIEINGVGYINLIGHSNGNEIVLIDSFYYKIKATNEQLDDNSDENNFIFGVNEDVIETEMDNFETTTYPNHDDDEDIDGEKVEPEVEEDVGLGTWAIALIGVGSATCLGMIVVGVYHLGKAAGIATHTPFLEDIEPSVRIPRVRSLRDSSVDLVRRTWF